MHFPVKRKRQLDPLLDKLSGSTSIVSVQADDFNSSSINVFVNLDVLCAGSSRFGGNPRPLGFTAHLRSIKASIKRICHQCGVSFNFLDWPSLQYVADGSGGKLKDGYSSQHIKIEVFV